ncbi:CHAD domain-containing protein [Bacillus sp. SG-1]|uniref:CHAD domain-containing protein n=1 Tax=Bacillus sp. SG-1 TaxID=161544 RepID=UPI0001543F5A|nr:CHAD domain-containing protein [Bacillus sp. SG-1]EDL66780.1 hypothetical protein BSG1_05470 [Bacillus sp. SG-1]
MKIISVTRILDDMGRIVIPEEARKALDIGSEIFLTINKKKHLIHLRKSGKGKKVTLDDSGRLTLPAKYLQQQNWETGSEIGLHIEGEKGTLQEQAPTCVICGSNQSLLKVKKTLICDDCNQEGNDALVRKWEDVLQTLLKKYKHYCDQAINSGDTESIHKSRTKGRRLRTLIHFIGVDKDHPLYKRLKDAHDALGKVREDDVFIHSFEKRAEMDQYGDVYHEFVKVARQDREKHLKKLKKKLPKAINDEFLSLFNNFLQDELKNKLLTLDIPGELQKQEDDFKALVKEYHQVIGDKGKTSDVGIDALHEVRKKAKKLRYIYNYLDKLYSKDYKSYSKPYKRIQKKFGEIIDIRDWLEEVKSLKPDVDSNKDDIKKIIKQLEQEKKKLVNEVEL